MLLKDLVRNYRFAKKWQQRDLAAKVGVSQNYISKIELGQAVPRSERFRERLLSALSIPRPLLYEAYAESKLTREEASAYKKAMAKGFKEKPRQELIPSDEETVLQAFKRLHAKERREVLELIAFKLRKAEEESD